jgi:hypothetical protein
MADAANRAARDKMGINSPSRVMREVGAFVAQGYAQGIAQGIPQVRAVSERMVSAPAPDVAGRGLSGSGAARDGAKAIGDAVADALQRSGVAGAQITVTAPQADPETVARNVARKLARSERV